LTLGANWDFAVIADANSGSLTPDERPPWTGRGWTQDGTFFGQRLLAGGVRGCTQLSMDFMLIDVGQELVEQVISALKLQDIVSRQERRQPLLPEVMAAFDFTLGLWGGRVTQGHTVEVECLTQLGESFGEVRKKQGMIVNVEGQGQAVGLEGPRQEIKVSQKCLTVIEAGTGIVTGGIIKQIQQALFVWVAGEPSMGAGVVLPEGPIIASLPAPDRLGRALIAGVGGQFVLNGPAADAGAVGLKFQTAVQFAGGRAVGRGRFGRKELGEQVSDFCRPIGMMITAREARRPGLSLGLSAGAQILAVKFIEARSGQA